jgi:hypothetical protein
MAPCWLLFLNGLVEDSLVVAVGLVCGDAATRSRIYEYRRQSWNLAFLI